MTTLNTLLSDPAIPSPDIKKDLSTVSAVAASGDAFWLAVSVDQSPLSPKELQDLPHDDTSTYEDSMPPTMLRPSRVQKIDVSRVLVLYNPHSGAQKGEALAEQARQFFDIHMMEVEYQSYSPSQHASQATFIALEHKGHGEEICSTVDVTQYDVICCLGGDGTFHECVNGYMNRSDDARFKVPLAVLPGGTGNSFSLELSNSTDMDLALRHIMRGLIAPIDISEVAFPTDGTKTYCFNSLHWGLASKVNVTAEKLRWMGKAVRYTTAALVELFNGDKTLARVVYTDAENKQHKVEDEYSVCIANMICTAAKGMKLAPDAKLNDGLIDVILIRSANTIDLAKVFAKFYDGTHKDLDFVDYIQCKEFSIVPFNRDQSLIDESKEDPKVAEEVLDIDGELKGITPFHLKVLQQALYVII
ncbi:hypothetical protein PROFUN_03101 [Planoprotostelium fungivorum]|uniref:DAGKc domain-containing protein n=1 Tax=Planoprotostelium fungivorum TaxID=1890364 RepID=A0A2P6NQ84_9EUKA|nr:hypothetical protein PROFUN_03101 [Planoprotostelium fungivorum]